MRLQRRRPRGLRVHGRARARRRAADGRVRPRRRQRPQRVGAAVALLRASRLQRAGGRPARARPLGRPAAAVGRGDRANGSRALLDAARGRARRRSSAIRSARSRRSTAPRDLRRASSKLALLGPAVPMPVSEVLLDAAKADDHVAFELINGWSHSAAQASSAATGCPGMWMTGAALRLMERTRARRAAYGPARLQRATRAGSRRPRRVRCPALVDPRPARPHGAAEERRGADATRSRDVRVVTLRGRRPRDDGRAARRGARCAAGVSLTPRKMGAPIPPPTLGPP